MYPSKCYEDVEKGADVVAYVCHVNTTSSSEDLAKAFGMRLWDLGGHVMKLAEGDIDFDELREVVDHASEDESDEVSVCVKALIRHDFLFIFQPNG
jgi:hypothetical protein